MSDGDSQLDVTAGLGGDSPIQRLEYVTLTDQVYQILKQRILTQEIRLGARLSVEELAEQLGVSRTPVREALRKLAGDGLVEVVPRSATRVRTFSEKDIEEIFDLRIALESLAARRAVEHLEDDTLADLQDRHEQAKKRMAEGDARATIEFDAKLHEAVLAACGNRRLQAIMERVNDYVTLFRNVGAIARDHHGFDYGHSEILEALQQRDADEAAQLFADHIAVAKEQTLTDFHERRILASGSNDAGEGD